MANGCPGQDNRKLSSAYYKCQHCDALVEIFSDELRFRCHQCGEYVYSNRIPSCVEWCSSAKECLGAERWSTIEQYGKTYLDEEEKHG